MTYPEHEKLAAVSDDSDKLGDFLVWLQENGYVLARWDNRRKPPQLWPCTESTESILAKHFEIDLDVLEREKSHMIEALRKANEG